MSRAGYGKGLNIRPQFAIPGASGQLDSTIPGAVTRASGDPLSVTVLISDMVTGRNVAEVFSSAEGAWEVKGLKVGSFYSARIRDKTRALNGAVLDWLEPD